MGGARVARRGAQGDWAGAQEGWEEGFGSLGEGRACGDWRRARCDGGEGALDELACGREV